MIALIALNSRGLICGPEESARDFYKRIEEAGRVPSVVSSPLAKKLFDIECDWVEVLYSNKGLNFWEGGCSWIQGPKVQLQLKSSFQKKEMLLGMYSKEQILAHELVHAARFTFEEPLFEEVLAYHTSSSFFQRFFGPFFRTPKEASCSLVIFLILFLAAFFTPFYKLALCSLFCMTAYGFFRLMRLQRIFSKTKRKLSALTDPQKALYIMLRLSDREIIRFSKMNLEEIRVFAEKKQKIELRWQQIYHSYFNASSPYFTSL